MATKITTVVTENSAITEEKLASSSVTEAKLASNSVTASKIAAGAVGASEIAAGAVGSSELANGSVTAAKLNVVGNGTAGQFLASDGDGSFSWGDSGITTTTGSAPYYAARAFVVFNGSGTILSQGNVSGVSRTSTGNYTITFSTAMPDANYAICGTAINKTVPGTTIIAGNTVPSAGSMTIQVRNTSSGVLQNVDLISITVFR